MTLTEPFNMLRVGASFPRLLEQFFPGIVGKFIYSRPQFLKFTRIHDDAIIVKQFLNAFWISVCSREKNCAL
jgi:hypothetical protein